MPHPGLILAKKTLFRSNNCKQNSNYGESEKDENTGQEAGSLFHSNPLSATSITITQYHNISDHSWSCERIYNCHLHII